MQIILRRNDTISPNQFIFYTIDMVIQREFDIILEETKLLRLLELTLKYVLIEGLTIVEG